MKNNINGKTISLEEDLKKRILRVIGKKGKKVYYITKELAVLLSKYLNETRMNLEIEDKHGKPFFFSERLKRKERTRFQNSRYLFVGVRIPTVALSPFP